MKHLLLLFLFLLGCGRDRLTPDIHSLPPGSWLEQDYNEFFSYVYLDDGMIRSVEYMNLKGYGANGLCSSTGGMGRRVYLDPSLKQDRLGHKIVLIHELLHCVVDAPHYTDELDIMNTSVKDRAPQFNQDLKGWINKVLVRMHIDSTKGFEQ